MKHESFRSIFFKGVAAGIMIGIGGIIYLMAENKVVGSFLFSFGLFTIIRYGFALYTGKVGYIPENGPGYIVEVLITLAGNICGTALASGLVLLTRISDKVHQSASAIMDAKLGDSIESRFILGVFCGLLMYLAVHNARNCRETGADTSLVFGTVVPVMIFILSGFNHSVADCFYYFAAYPTGEGIIYLGTVVVGNAIGGMLIPFLKKFTFDKQEVK